MMKRVFNRWLICLNDYIPIQNLKRRNLMAVSVLEIAESRGISSPSPEEFERVGLPAQCKCFVCGNIIPHDQAFPSYGGKIKCSNHLLDSGFRTAIQFENYSLVYSLHKKDKS